MKKIETFDAELREQYKYEFLMSKVLWFILGGMGTFFMLIPVQAIWEENLLLIGVVLPMAGTSFWFRPYMMITEKGKIVSVFQKLKWSPISKKEICMARIKYVSEFCLKVLVIAMLFQQIGSALSGTFGIASLLYPVIVWGLIWLSQVIYIYSLK
ncbi:MAG: hypothetical protein IJX66_11690 [Lachnospiraceae bacterium]|nr:hypothetical protein [Lachnospiraceae bacterium]